MRDNAYIAAGYFLTRPVRGPLGEGAGLPARFLTLNEHLAPTLPSTRFLEGSEPWPGRRMQERLHVLEFFSIDPSRVEELRGWLVDPANAGKMDWDFDGGAVLPEFVRETAHRFLPAETDATILGLSAATSDVDAMTRCFGEMNDSPDLPRWTERRAPRESGGRIVGFDPAPILQECPQRACSWICEALDWGEVERELGLRLNGYGLLDTYEQACRACGWLHRRGDLCGGDRWFPWAITEYGVR